MKTSIFLCTYNGEEFIEKQLRSYAMQTQLPDELVVFDDCSNDNTLAILEQFKQSAPFNVIIKQNEKNLGYTKNFLKNIPYAKGDIVLLSDQDDIWLPNKIEEMVKAFEKDPYLKLVFSNANLINERDEIILLDYLAKLKMYKLWDNLQPDLLGTLLKNFRFINGCLMVVSSHVVKLIEQFNKDYPTFEHLQIHDQFIATLCAISYPKDFVREIYMPLMQYRIHKEQATFSSPPKNLSILEQVFQKKIEKNKRLNYQYHWIYKIRGVSVLLDQKKEHKERITKFLHFYEKRVTLSEESTFLKRLRFVIHHFLNKSYSKYTQSPVKEMIRDLL